jgi:hypothetical protein
LQKFRDLQLQEVGCTAAHELCDFLLQELCCTATTGTL